MPSPLPPLPIDDALPQLGAALASHPAAVLVAPPGAGKTTRVPPYLLAAGLAGGGRIVMLEPRRIAARAAARRIAEEHGWSVGEEVGYQVRFERKESARTRILVVTEGILVQRLQADPFLDGVGAVLFDEIHERNLATDLSLAMARRVQLEARPELRLVAMSATLDPGPLARFLGGCPVVESTGRSFPVEIRHTDRPPAARGERSLPAEVAAAVRGVLPETPGDVLVFLPGVGEIERAAEALAGLAAERDLALLPLYGDLPVERQDAVLKPGPRRKVVLATNVAETSITVDGVTAVVDAGLVRRLRFDPGSGLDRLELGRVSRASADQRAGRAGRQGPGLCLRLWPAYEHAAQPERETPEIARVDLAGTYLQLAAWGERDPAAFGWLEAPAPEALAAAAALLRQLGALDGQGVTADGQAMARLPAHPRLARLLLSAHRLGCLPEAALAAALLAERDPFPRRGRAPRAAQSDLFERLDALAAFTSRRGGEPPPDLNRGAARQVLKAREQLEDMAVRTLGPPAPLAKGEREDLLSRALVEAFPDRLVRRRGPREPRGVMVGGKGVRLSEESAVLEPDLFLALDVDGAGPEARVRLASGVTPAHLPEALLASSVDLEWDAERERVTAWKRLRFADLVLSESEVPAPSGPRTEEILVREAGADLPRALPLADPEVDSFLTRLACLRAWRPELGLPAFDAEALGALLPSLAAGARSFAELRKAPLLDILAGTLTHEQRRALDEEAPERLAVPSGSRIRLQYEEGKPPVLAARIQELFGLAATPRIACGRVPVLLHLLAPSGRPQQVTQDLASFWATTYREVRKELAGRYPKHAWPEDPTTARPERRPGRHPR